MLSNRLVEFYFWGRNPVLLFGAGFCKLFRLFITPDSTVAWNPLKLFSSSSYHSYFIASIVDMTSEESLGDIDVTVSIAACET